MVSGSVDEIPSGADEGASAAKSDAFDEAASGSDEGVSAAKSDAFLGVIHGSFADCASSSAAGVVPPGITSSTGMIDESFSGAQCDIVEGNSPAEESFFATGTPACWPGGGRLDDGAMGVADLGCSGASENASVVDTKDCVSAVVVAMWL